MINKISKIVFLGLASTAHADDLAKTDNVNNHTVKIIKTEGTQETVDTDGTENKAKLYRTTKTDSDGNTESTTTVESSKDPKGLGNKTTLKSKIKKVRDENGSYRDEQDTSSVDSEGTSHSRTEEKDYIKNSDGTSKSVYKEKLVKDPKGLNNSSTNVIDETITRDANGNIIKDQSDNRVDETMRK